MKKAIVAIISWVVLTTIAGTSLASVREEWIGSWAMSPTGLPTMTKLGTFEVPPPVIIKGTLRYRIRLSQGGRQVRLRLSNEYGQVPLLVGAVSIGVAGRDLDAQPGSLISVTFAGNGAIRIPVGAPAVSDPVDLAVKGLSDLVVSVYIPEAFLLFPQVFPLFAGSDTPGLAADSNEVLAAHFPITQPLASRPIISAVDVLAARPVAVLATLGDSITEGRMDPATGERGWPDALARRPQSQHIAVVNAGIGGNRLLQSVDLMGRSALARLDQDVFSIPGLTHMVVLEGINDIGMSGPGGMLGDTPLVRPEELIAAYCQIITRAHERGIRVLGATILPFEGAFYYSQEKERIRQAVNAWIRRSKAFDGVIDFDQIMGDPTNPHKLNPEYDPGDHLHPNPAGYRKMGEILDLDLITKRHPSR